MDEIDLLREQHKVLSGEVALYMSALKRFSEEAAQNPKDEHLQVIFFKLYYSHSKFSLGIHSEVALCMFSMPGGDNQFKRRYSPKKQSDSFIAEANR